MDKWQALQSFFSSFGLTAYDESSVPESAQLPYITYQAAADSLDSPVVLTGDLYYKSTSWTEISQKADEINDALKNGVIMPLDIGFLWLVRGSPFAQRINEDSDTLKHIYIVLMGEFLTE